MGNVNEGIGDIGECGGLVSVDDMCMFGVSFMRECGVNNLIRIGADADGSCYFNSILRSCKMGYAKGSRSERKEMSRLFRDTLSNLLLEPDENGIINYEKLCSGNIRNFGIESGNSEYSLYNMITELRSNSYIDNIFQSLISDATKFDIYILHLSKNKNGLSYSETFNQLPTNFEYVENHDFINPFNSNTILNFYKTTDKFKIELVIPLEEINLIYKNRRSIILLYHSDIQHYESVGKIKYINQNGKNIALINTVFDPSDNIIKILHNHIINIKYKT